MIPNLGKRFRKVLTARGTRNIPPARLDLQVSYILKKGMEMCDTYISVKPGEVTRVCLQQRK